MTMYIIDRTKNSSGKSIPIKQRFYDRAQRQIQENITRILKTGNIKDIASGTNNSIVLKSSDIAEPSFHFDYDKSDWMKILPGNPNTPEQMLISFDVGDKISKPKNGDANGSGGSPDGEGVDDFIFTLSPEDWSKYLYDKLRLPNEDETKAVKNIESWKKAGLSTSGMPANLSLIRTMRNSIGRRIGLHRPKEEYLLELEEKYNNTEGLNEKAKIQEEIDEVVNRMVCIPWIDPIDVRYVNHVKEMQPKMNAVMFCLMDVSASMTEYMKDLAKRFYVFLYRFLKTRYKDVEVVFIRHTHIAEEVTEEKFFYDPTTGGTVVSTALEKMIEIVKDRYPVSDWNIYGAQVSDGDNTESDTPNIQNFIKEILDISQFYVYLEVNRSYKSYATDWNRIYSDLWKVYDQFAQQSPGKFVMKRINGKEQIWQTMLEIFGK